MDDVAILKKGTSEWGWTHIVERGHDIQIRQALGLADSGESVKKVIAEVLEYGRITNHVAGDKFEIVRQITRNQKTHDILVVVSDRIDAAGSIVTAYPI